MPDLHYIRSGGLAGSFSPTIRSGRLAGRVFRPFLWGIALFSASVLFTVVTLPVEFNASNRAVAALWQTGVISGREAAGTTAVPSVAGLTYVAAAITAILQLLYLLWRAGFLGGSSDD